MSSSVATPCRLFRMSLVTLVALSTARPHLEIPEELDHRIPTRDPTQREAGDSGVSLEQAKRMPWFATHRTVCDGRPCKPGEGNLKHVRENLKGGDSWRFKQWAQPYIHREAWVQYRSRNIPHQPDPATTYAPLVRVARSVATNNLVLVTSGDFDYRELVLNWYGHTRKLGYSNAMAIAMDRELVDYLSTKRVPVADNSAQLRAWNDTCLQRHIQAVRVERHIAVAALLAAGLDVLHMDATVILLRDVIPLLAAAPDADVLMQRDEWPNDPLVKIGSASNAGFYLARARRGAEVVRLVIIG